MKLVFKTTPYPHQVRALRFLLRRVAAGARGGGLFVRMRWGKTKVAIDFAAALALKYGIKRVLVVTVSSGLGVWEDEIHTHEPDQVDLEWFIVNYEGTYDRIRTPTEDSPGSWEPVDSDQLEEFDADLVVIDESHHIGRPTAVQSKKVTKLASNARFVLFMTGTPFHRKPFFIFGQFKAYDDSVFGTSWTNFKKQIAVFSPYNPHVINYRNLKWLRKKVRKHVFIEDSIPRREPVIQPIRFNLEESNAVYAQMERESFARVGDEAVTAPIILTKHLRLQQIAGGWVRTEDGNLRRVGKEKLRMFTDHMQELYDSDVKKVVVGCRFLPEVVDAARAARKAGYRVTIMHGGVPKGDERKRRFKWFNDVDEPAVLVSQVRAAREAVNLSAADTLIFYSLPEDYLTYDQFSARIEKYDEKRTLAYYIFIARGTRDEISWIALRNQKDVASLIMKKPRLVERITAKL